MNIKQITITGIIFLIIDILWLNLVMKHYFGKMVYLVQKEPMRINILGGFIVYVILILGLNYFAIDKLAITSTYYEHFLLSGIFGLVTYGIFDFTNLAIFNNYSLPISIIDTMWGGLVCMSTSLLYMTIKNKLIL